MMQTPTRLGLALGLALLAPLVLPVPQAAAQFSGAGVVGKGESNDRKPDTRKPAALPGARGVEQTPAAAERPPADLPPTEALFDAVNRGDIAAARDALSRGADVDGRNILGLTPLELAIDLGRNDLTFLLLSMRGAAGSAALAPPPPPARETRPSPPLRAAVPAPAPVPQPPPRQRQAVTDPGTPVPQSGFLGFGPAPR